MTATELLNQIRSEIERRMNGAEKSLNDNDTGQFYGGVFGTCKNLLCFLDTIKLDKRKPRKKVKCSSYDEGWGCRISPLLKCRCNHFSPDMDADKPEGLDEAADAYSTESVGWNPDGTEKYQVIQEEVDAFKAGAEWMAEQGVSVEGKVVMDFSEPYDIVNLRLVAKLGDALLKVDPGDVIVQIRKKDGNN